MKGHVSSSKVFITFVCASTVFITLRNAYPEFNQTQNKNHGVVYRAQNAEGDGDRVFLAQPKGAEFSDEARQALRLRHALETKNKDWLPLPEESLQIPQALAALKTALTLKEAELGMSDQAFQETAKEMDDLRFELELKNKAVSASYLAAEQAKKELESFKKSSRNKNALAAPQEKRKETISKNRGVSSAQQPTAAELEAKKRNLSLKLKEAERLQKELQGLHDALALKNKELLELKREKRKAERELNNLRVVSKEKEAVEKEKLRLAKDNDTLRRERVTLRVELLKVKNSDNGNKEKELLAMKKEKEVMQARILSLEENTKKEKAKFYQDLGTAYTQARIFDLAIKEYEKSLSYDPANAQVHYYLGLLYAHAKNDSKKSVRHLRKYLEYSPVAENIDEVRHLIKVIQQ